MPQRTDPGESGAFAAAVTQTRIATVAAAVGLHARPAARFTEAVAALAPLRVTVTDDAGRTADGASILSVLALGIPHGARVTLTALGDGAGPALDGLVELLESDLDA